MAEIRGAYVTVKGVKTYYEDNQGPANPHGTLVCLHTAGRDTRQYHGLMEYLGDKYRIVAFDFPAHGKSWPLPGLTGIKTKEDYGEFTWAFIQALGITDPIVVGCSVAGNMVYYLAENYPVRAMVSMQGSAQILAMQTSYGTTVDLLDNPYVSCQHSHWDFSESLIGRYASKEAHDLIMWGVCQEIGRTKKCDLSLYNNYDVTGDLHKITCPSLLIRGTDDWNVPDHYYETAIKGMVNCPKLSWKKVEGYGHFIAVEAPEIVGDLIDEFLNEANA